MIPRIYSVSALLDEVNDPKPTISRNKLYDALESGDLVGRKVGNKWLIPEPNVLAWLGLDRTESPPADAKDDPVADVVHFPTAKQGGER